MKPREMAVAVAPRPLCHNRHCAVKGKSLYSQVPPALAASPRRRAAPSLQTRLPRPQADVRSLESRNLLSQGSGLSDRHTQPGGIDGRVAGARGPSKLHAVASYPAANAAYAPGPEQRGSCLTDSSSAGLKPRSLGSPPRNSLCM